MASLSPQDPSSFSKPDAAVVKHVSLNLKVDFNKKVLSGTALLEVEILKAIDEFILDMATQSINSIELHSGKNAIPLNYEVRERVPNFGSKLVIDLPKKAIVGEKLKLRIAYVTSPDASAFQWLDPDQTSGKKHPYLFSQCQPIHARSFLPIQDTPAVKFTYDANIEAPEEFTVLMSAISTEKVEKGSGTKKSHFVQSVPIPSYLLAIAVAVLESRRLGPRSLVWSESQEIEKSESEFSLTESYLLAAEKLCGPYVWGRYDLLVLPPSFPYGGMENPCLTFVTPTLLAGDKSLADVIVHEIMHSWTGNLVTNKNFEHFWLNEGFTVFLERKVAASLIEDEAEAKRSRDFHSILGLQELNETIKELGDENPLTKLVLDLKGVHPDDSFSRVPYEKGSLFLRYLEDLVGGPDIFDDFMRAYLTEFKENSLDTNQFQTYFMQYFKNHKATKAIRWNDWLNTCGMPPLIPIYDDSMTKDCKNLVAYVNRENANNFRFFDIQSFTPHQVIYFLQQLIEQDSLPLDKYRSISLHYGFDTSNNAEIKYRWLRLGIKAKDDSILDDALNFVNAQGRMKYVRPIYRDLYAWPEMRRKAIDNFMKNEKYMMHVTAYTLRKDLHLPETDTPVTVI